MRFPKIWIFFSDNLYIIAVFHVCMSMIRVAIISLNWIIYITYDFKLETNKKSSDVFGVISIMIVVMKYI